jgi:hypothetical protein
LLDRFKLRRTAVEWALAVLFGTTVVWQAFVPPPIGMAPNGDFGKVAAFFNLTAPTEDEFKFLTRIWHFDPASHWWSGFFGAEHILTAAAIGVNQIFRHDGLFDIRMIGAVHTSIFLLGFVLLLPLLRGLGPRAGFSLGLVLICIFGGTMYVEWMNTFYMDTAALVFLALAAVFYLRAAAWHNTPDLIGFAISATLFAAAKAQHAPLALPIASLILFDTSWNKNPTLRKQAISLVIAGAAAAWWFKPADYQIGPIYDAIFLEILPGSHSVDRDLRELGLDSSYRDLVGAFSDQPTSPMRQPEFASKFASRTSHARIFLFLAKHPMRGVRIVTDGLGWAGKQRPAMGDFERSTGRAAFTQSRAFSVWSDLKKKIFDQRGGLYLGYIAALCTASLAIFWRTPHRKSALCLVAMAIMAMLIATLADAVETTRHCFILNVLVDFMFAAVCSGVIGRQGARRELPLPQSHEPVFHRA